VSAQRRTFLLLSRYPPPGERSPGQRAPRGWWLLWRALDVRAAPWSQLVEELAELGWFLPPSYPGRATVIGFDEAGRGRVLVTGAETAHAFADAIAGSLGNGDPATHHLP
jgi:hypothetical protein